jgi:hypothetical protein
MRIFNIKIIRKPGQGIIVLIGLLFLLAFAPALYAETYYVDDIMGRDINDGLTQDTAWKTIARVNIATFNPGDMILFKRGGSWREQLDILSSGSSDSPLVFGAYSSGDNPVILGSVSRSLPNSWTQDTASPNLWYAGVSVRPNVIWRDGMRMTQAATKDALNSWTQWWFDSMNSRVYTYSPSSAPVAGGHTFEIAQRDYCVRATDKNYVKIDGFTLRYVNKSLIRIDRAIGTCRGWEIANNTISGGYAEAMYDRAGGILIKGSAVNDADSTHIHHNILEDIGGDVTVHSSYITLYYGDSFKINYNTIILSGLANEGHAYGIHVRHTSPTGGDPTPEIAYNVVSGDSGSGTRTAGACIFVTDARHVVIKHNVLISANIGIRGDESAPDYQDGPRYCTWEYNLIQPAGGSNAPSAFILEASKDNVFRYNVVNMKNASINGVAFGRAIWISRGTSDTRIFNNTVVVPNGMEALQVSWTGDNMYTKRVTAKNNVFYAFGQCMSGLISIQKNDPNDTGNGHIFDYNVYYATGRYLINWMGNYYDSVGPNSTFTRVSRQEANGTVNDPLFRSYSENDFRVLPNSPCIGHGADIGLLYDFTGNPVPAGTPPDIGAYQNLRVLSPRGLRITGKL